MSEKVKPFIINLSDTDKTEKEVKNLSSTAEMVKEPPKPGVVYRDGKELIQPFTTVDTPVEKLYLILKYYENRENPDGEMERDFEFFTGTSQSLYDHLKEEIMEQDDQDCKLALDVMKSRVLVDSPNIKISHKCTVFIFMKDIIERGKAIDESSFDIMDYYYEEEEK